MPSMTAIPNNAIKPIAAETLKGVPVTKSAKIDIAYIIQALAECIDQILERVTRRYRKKPDHWHRGLLRAGRDRPRHRRTAESQDERAPFHILPAG